MKVLGFSGDNNYEALTPEEVLAALGLQSSIAELNYTDGVTSNIQTQLNGKFNNPSGTIAQYIRGDGTLFNFPGVGNGIILSANNIHLGSPSSVTLASTNSTTSTSHTHAFSPGGTTSQYIRGDGSLATFPTVGSGTVTSVSAGNGLNFTTITGSGSVTLGTPSTISGSTTNSVTSTSHTHALSANLSSWDAISPFSKYDYSAADDAGLVQWKTTADLNVRHGTGSGVKFFRAINSTANTPIPNSYFSCMQMTYDSTGGAQLLLSVVAERMWFRRSPNASWVEAYHTGNFANGTTSQYIRGDGSLATLPTISTALTTENLDDVVADGIYHQAANANTSAARNYPINLAGMLEVSAGPMIYQRYTTYNNGMVFTRVKYASAWSPWSQTWASNAVSISESAVGGTLVQRDSTGNIFANRVDVSMNYTSTGNAVALSPGSAGTIYLRPSGLGQTVNQTTISSDGSLSVSGTISDVDGDVRRMKGRVANGSTTLAVSDLNGVVEKNNNGTYTYTLAASLGTVRDAITIVNSGPMGSITLARASGVTLYRNGVNTNITIGPGSMVTIYRSNTTNRWIA